MEFQKYSSIENSYRQEFIDKILEEQKDQGVWLVTEKIHGSNFSFWYDGKKFRMAKRTCWIADGDDFYGIQKLKDDLVEKVKQLYAMLSVDRKIDYIAVFGEIFGGSYPHPDVPRSADAKKVQKGIYYCPDNRFMIYDVKVDDEYADFNAMQKMCGWVGLPFFMALFTGTFAECLEYPNDFQSTIAHDFNFPEIEDNICEGIVIRPNKTRFLRIGKRVILKSKNEKWAEKASRKKKKRTLADFSKEAKEFALEMQSFVTENRYDAVVSKMGEVKISDFGKIHGEFGKDVHKEFMKDTKKALDYNNLEKEEQKRIKKAINQEIANIIRKKLVRGE